MWYSDEISYPVPQPVNHVELERRKAVIESRLAGYGIEGTRITFLPYLDFDPDEFQPTMEVGRRILILWAVSNIALNLNEKDEVADWLKRSMLWDSVSPRERELFAGNTNERALMNFSWQIEAFIVLCWAVNLLDDIPDLSTSLTDQELVGLRKQLPINHDPTEFLANISYRNKEEIFIENIINELVTSNLRDMMLSGKKKKLKLDASISLERHRALNWLRQFSGISEWDETDTST